MRGAAGRIARTWLPARRPERKSRWPVASRGGIAARLGHAKPQIWDTPPTLELQAIKAPKRRFGLPRTLPGGVGQRDVIRETVDSDFRAAIDSILAGLGDRTSVSAGHGGWRTRTGASTRRPELRAGTPTSGVECDGGGNGGQRPHDQETDECRGPARLAVRWWPAPTSGRPRSGVSARPASSPGVGARPWCASGRRATR